MKTTSIERDFPFVVEVAVAPARAHKTLDLIHAFHRRYGIKPRAGQKWTDERGHEHIRWCFAVPIIADFFMMEFGRARSAKNIWPIGVS